MQTVTLTPVGRQLLQSHRDWWQRTGPLLTRVEGSPLGDLWMPLADGSLATSDVTVTPDLLDVERLVGPSLPPGPVMFFGDRFHTTTAFGRVPWVEAILGTPIRATIQGGSMRTMAFVRDFEEWESIPQHRHQGWYDLLLDMTRMLVERSGGSVAVVQPTMRGPCDLAEAVLGPELMSYAMVDSPGALARFIDEVTDAFIEILHALLAIIPPLEGGYVSPFGIWAPGTVVRTQCDATAFLSARHYAKWYLPQDVRISKSVEYSIIHLHSCSLHTVDALLDVERPQAIQITLESSPPGPSLQAMLPIFRNILARKPLLLEGKLSEDELAWLQAELPSGGLAITARTSDW